MEKKLLVRCEHGHLAHRVCVLQKCTYPAPICSDEGCEYFRKHDKCFLSLDLRKLINTITKEGRKYEVMDEEVIRSYDYMIKLVEIEKYQYLKLIKEPGMRLKGEEGRLYRLLKEGTVKHIRPAMVFNVIEGLADTSKTEIEKLKSEATELGKKVVQKVEESVKVMRKLWGNINKP